MIHVVKSSKDLDNLPDGVDWAIGPAEGRFSRTKQRYGLWHRCNRCQCRQRTLRWRSQGSYYGTLFKKCKGGDCPDAGWRYLGLAHWYYDHQPLKEENSKWNSSEELKEARLKACQPPKGIFKKARFMNRMLKV